MPNRVMDETGKKLSVLHLTHNMSVGGTEFVIVHLVGDNVDKKYHQRVVCIDGHIGSVGVSMQEKGIEVHSISRTPGFDIKTIFAVRKLINKFDASILHCHQYTPFTYGVLAAIFTGTKVVYTEHGRFYPDRFTWKRRLVNQLLSRMADSIVSISESTRHALQEYEWIPGRRVTTIYNGVDTPMMVSQKHELKQLNGISDDCLVLGSISRLDSIKNQAIMIQACARLVQEGHNVILLLCGDGPERQNLINLSVELGIQNRVLFTGFITDIGGYLNVIDVFLLTSFSEGASMTLLEAMSYSKPIIASSVGGNTELVENGVSGLCFESDNLEQLTAHLHKCLNSESYRNALGEGALSRYKLEFTRENMVDNYLLLYDKVTSST